MSISNIQRLEKYAARFSESIPTKPTGKFASMILLRETKSYSIFTTESGEQQDTESTQAGLKNPERLDRLVMFKRKQVAPERRTGKALLRQYGAFPLKVPGQKEPIEDCYLIAGMCTHCVDCLVYGFAAIEGEGARKSRVYTDSCFSVRPYPLIQRKIKFNTIEEDRQTSLTITEFDYTLPEVFLPAIETTLDLTLDEFVYVLNNVLKTNRYGKEGTRQGFVRNHLLAIAFSDVELFSNLEFTQAFYDAFIEDKDINFDAGYLSFADFQRLALNFIETLT
jgi:CRISPR-associated protein Csc2